MTLSQKLAEHVAACFTGLWVQSFEHEDALAEIAALCKQRGWRLATWDVDRGLQAGDAAPGAADPLAALRALPAMAAADSSALLVLPNFHRFLGSAEIAQAVAHAVAAGKQARTFVVVLSPVVQIPVELEKSFVVIEHDLPDRSQLESIARGVATEPGELPEGEGLGAVFDAAAGLTRYEAEGALALSLVRHGRVTPETLWELKAQALRKSGLLTLHRGRERFGDLGGLDALKQFCRKALRPGAKHPLARARGILLLGVPGRGQERVRAGAGQAEGHQVVGGLHHPRAPGLAGGLVPVVDDAAAGEVAVRGLQRGHLAGPHPRLAHHEQEVPELRDHRFGHLGLLFGGQHLAGGGRTAGLAGAGDRVGA